MARSSLQKMQQQKHYAQVNSSRDHAFMQNAVYSQAEVEGYTIDKQLSNSKGVVYVNNKTGKATIAFAGTQFAGGKGESKLQKRYREIDNQYRVQHGMKPTEAPTVHKNKTSWKQSLRDIGADLNIAMGTEENSNEFKKADEQYQQVIKKYGQENVDLTGHSLGGTKAAYLSHKHGAYAETYNQGASLTGSEQWDLRNVTAHVTTGDVVPTGVHQLKHTGIHVENYHQRLGQYLKDELKHQVEGAVKGWTGKKVAKTGISVATEPGSSAEAAAQYGMAKAGEAAAVYGGVKEAGKIESHLHDSGQFVPKGRTDAAMQQEKPRDSKPIPAPPSSKPAQPAPPAQPTPKPAPAPKPVPPPAPAPSTNPSSGSGYRSRYHIGSGGI